MLIAYNFLVQRGTSHFDQESYVNCSYKSLHCQAWRKPKLSEEIQAGRL
jgi:hypothetical protein